MAEHQVLYRQWRPLTFASMVGQELVVNALRNQVRTGRLAHAYLFCGSRGTGKTSTAKILARAVNCENPKDGDACGECESCRRLQDESSFDILEYDAASNSRVEDMRSILETVQYPPQYGRYKVFVIDEVHMLSANAFNALLKTLEEPPSYMIFILATTEPHKVPATILSRCQRYDFGRIPARQIVGRLREAVDHENVKATDGALMQIARAAEGGMRDALSILDMCIGYGQDVDETLVRHVLGTSDRSFLFRFAESLINQDASAALGCIDELMNAGHEPAVFAREFAGHVRLLLVARTIPDQFAATMDLTEETAASYIGQAGTASESRLMSIMDIFLDVDSALRYAASPRFALESAALHACLRTEEADTAALLDRVQELEGKLKSLQDQITSGAVQISVSKPNTEPAPKEPARPRKSSPAVKDRTMEQIWKDAMTQLARNDPGTFAQLGQGQLVSAEAYTFHWAPKSEEAGFSAAILAKPDKTARIEETLSSIAEQPCHFIVNRTPGSVPQPEAEAPSLDDVYKTFGAENISIQES